MVVEFKYQKTVLNGKKDERLRVETVDLAGVRRWVGDVELEAVIFRPRFHEALEAELLERIAERLYSVRCKRRQALREARA